MTEADIAALVAAVAKLTEAVRALEAKLPAVGLAGGWTISHYHYPQSGPIHYYQPAGGTWWIGGGGGNQQ